MIKLPKWWRGLRFIPARVGYYLRYDLKEIITPSSIPNPPDYVEPPKRGVGNLWKVFMGANRDYINSWDAEKVRQKYAAEFEDDRVRHGEPKEEDREPPGTVVEEFTAAARGGADAMKPFLQKVYRTRASTYTETVQKFVLGYKEGLQEVSQREQPETDSTAMKAPD